MVVPFGSPLAALRAAHGGLRRVRDASRVAVGRGAGLLWAAAQGWMMRAGLLSAAAQGVDGRGAVFGWPRSRVRMAATQSLNDRDAESVTVTF